MTPPGPSTWRAGTSLLAVLLASCAGQSGHGGGLAPSWWITRHEVRGVVEATQPLTGPEGPLVVTAERFAGLDGAPGTNSTLRCGDDGASPEFLVVPVGQRVHFQNVGEIYHRFFSSSEENGFELDPVGPSESQAVRLQHPGLVRVYCELHSGKQATLLVVPSPHFAVVGPDGSFTLAGLPKGHYRVQAWRDGMAVYERELDVPGAARIPLRIPLEEPTLGAAR